MFTVVSASAALLVAAALPAYAHVRVSSPDATPGGFGKLVFRVPTESDTASTTKLSVRLPSSTPFAFVSSKVHSGWTVDTSTRKLSQPLKVEGVSVATVVSTVTWTAKPGRGIKPGQFDEFELSVGPFPKNVDSLSMPAVQTYSDGTVVRWVQPTTAGQAEPEHPAPTLELSAAATNDASSEPSPSHDDARLTADTTSTIPADDATARWLGGIGLALGAVAVAVAVSTRRRRA